ncbi:MAG: hypothetical protein M3N45_15295, partial [Actinomycetota bacterium]|nr:hypothetical protein [Actinomycetota bacterium]
MNKYSTFVWSIIALMATLAASACSVGPFNVSGATANISDAYMAGTPGGNPGPPVIQTTVFTPEEDAFYCIAELSNAPDDTVVRALWIAVDVEGAPPNTEIDETSITSGDGQLTFDLTHNPFGTWSEGQYKVDLFLNDERQPERTLEFSVRAYETGPRNFDEDRE